MIHGEDDLFAQDDFFLADRFDFALPIPIGNVMDNDLGHPVTVTHVDGQPVDPVYNLLVPGPFEGLAMVVVFDDGTVEVEVWEPFVVDTFASFTCTVTDGFGGTSQALVDIVIIGGPA